MHFDDLCHQGKTNDHAWFQASAQFKVVIRIQCYFISKDHSFKLFKLTKLAYVERLSRHDSSRDFPIQFVGAMCSMEPYIGLKFKAVIPKCLWVPDLMSFLLEPFLAPLSFFWQHLTMG